MDTNYMLNTNTLAKNLRDIADTLASVDASLQSLAYRGEDKITQSFVNKKTICHRLSVPSVAVDKLIHQGIASGGKSGLVEGVHYCKIDPEERNSSKFLYDAHRVMNSAWTNFQSV